MFSELLSPLSSVVFSLVGAARPSRLESLTWDRCLGGLRREMRPCAVVVALGGQQLNYQGIENLAVLQRLVSRFAAPSVYELLFREPS